MNWEYTRDPFSSSETSGASLVRGITISIGLIASVTLTVLGLEHYRPEPWVTLTRGESAPRSTLELGRGAGVAADLDVPVPTYGERVVSTLQQLTLGGTLNRGDDVLAIINGTTVEVGNPLPGDLEIRYLGLTDDGTGLIFEDRDGNRYQRTL